MLSQSENDRYSISLFACGIYLHNQLVLYIMRYLAMQPKPKWKSVGYIYMYKAITISCFVHVLRVMYSGSVAFLFFCFVTFLDTTLELQSASQP